jgi:hypothetical protein
MIAAEREAEETRLVRVRSELGRACGSMVEVVVNGQFYGYFWIARAGVLIRDLRENQDGGELFALVLRDQGCEESRVRLLDARHVADVTRTPEERAKWRVDCVVV